MKTLHMLPLALSLLLPAMAANAGNARPAGIAEDVRQDLAEARREVRADLAKARRELDTGNLDVGDGLHFGKGKRPDGRLPRAEITPEGDLLIAGKAQDISLSQRRQLLVYRGQVVEIARTGIDIGERTAVATLDAVGNSSVVGLVFGAMTGNLERRVERLVRENVEPGVRGICRQLPAVRDSQQRIAASLPQFRPYATLQQRDVDSCERDLRNDFASL